MKTGIELITEERKHQIEKLEMEIKELKNRKTLLENQIQKCIADFENETEIQIYDVRLRKTDVSTAIDKRYLKSIDIEIKI